MNYRPLNLQVRHTGPRIKNVNSSIVAGTEEGSAGLFVQEISFSYQGQLFVMYKTNK